MKKSNNIANWGWGMLKIKLVLRVIFLGLLVKFSCMECAAASASASHSFGEMPRSRATSTIGSSVAFAAGALPYFTRVHRKALENPELSVFCRCLFGEGDKPWFGAPPVAEVLERISMEVCVGDGAPLRGNVKKRSEIMDALVIDAVYRLNIIGDSNNRIFLWVFSRFTDLLLRDESIPAMRPWFNRISAAGEVSEHLSGSAGIVTATLDHISRDTEDLSVLNTTDQGTNIYFLSRMFGRAAQAFPELFYVSKRSDKDRGKSGVEEFSALYLFEFAILETDCRDHGHEAARLMTVQLVDVGADRERLRVTLEATEVQRDALQRNAERLQGEVGILRHILDGIGCCARFWCCIPDHRRAPLTETTPLMRDIASVNGSR